MAKIIDSLAIIAVSLVFLSIGAYFLLYQDYDVMNNWKNISGTVTNSSVILVDSVSDSSDEMYGPHISYKYSFGNKSYSGHCCSASSNLPSLVQPIVDRNPIGKNVDVFVNPNNPYQSRLADDVNLFDPFKLFFMFCSGGILILGIWSLIFSLKN
jgi:hypothetical protein